MVAHSTQNTSDFDAHEVLDSLPLATALLKPSGEILFANRFFAECFAVSVEQMQRQNIAEFSPQCFQVFEQNLLRFKQGLPVEPFEYQMEGRYYWIVVKPNCAPNGEIESLLLCSSDISDLKQNQMQLEARNHELRRISEKDYLTGLSNRRAFDLKLQHYLQGLAQNEIQELTLLLIDVDNFKQINDCYGHSLGDDALKTMAKTLLNVSAVEVAKNIYRVGGEEFAILLPNTTLEQGCVQAEQYRQAVEALGQDFHGQCLNEFSISVGVAHTAEFLFARRLYELADQALYCAKSSRKNFVYYTNHTDCYSYPLKSVCCRGAACG
jgi:diguanylate cyclase (GGDEF)-like protein/PAS domain S-box-containing protein